MCRPFRIGGGLQWRGLSDWYGRIRVHDRRALSFAFSAVPTLVERGEVGAFPAVSPLHGRIRPTASPACPAVPALPFALPCLIVPPQTFTRKHA